MEKGFLNIQMEIYFRVSFITIMQMVKENYSQYQEK
jgi:hypothetical protein